MPGAGCLAPTVVLAWQLRNARMAAERQARTTGAPSVMERPSRRALYPRQVVRSASSRAKSVIARCPVSDLGPVGQKTHGGSLSKALSPRPHRVRKRSSHARPLPRTEAAQNSTPVLAISATIVTQRKITDNEQPCLLCYGNGFATMP